MGWDNWVTVQTVPEALPSKELDNLISRNEIVCPECDGELSNVYKFNMMFRFSAGPRLGNKVALRPETCQSIFLDFLRVYNTMRAKLPIGLAQVGKSFRNEISPRRNLIRLRELTQAEIEVFFNPKKIEFFTKFDAVKSVTLTFLLINDQKIASAYSLVGSIVTGLDANSESVTDMVAKVKIEENNPLLVLANNVQLELKDLIEISLL